MASPRVCRRLAARCTPHALPQPMATSDSVFVSLSGHERLPWTTDARLRVRVTRRGFTRYVSCCFLRWLLLLRPWRTHRLLLLVCIDDSVFGIQYSNIQDSRLTTHDWGHGVWSARPMIRSAASGLGC